MSQKFVNRRYKNMARAEDGCFLPQHPTTKDPNADPGPPPALGEGQQVGHAEEMGVGGHEGLVEGLWGGGGRKKWWKLAEV